MNTQRSISSVFTKSSDEVNSYYNTFLNIFSINLSHRFPDVTDIESIDYDSVRQVATFSAACARIALEAWQDVTRWNLESRRDTRRESRAA